MTTVVVVDDHTLVRQSLVKTMGAEDDFEVVGEAALAEEAVDICFRRRPDIVLLDIGLPDADGLDVAARVRKLSPATRIVFVTMHDDDASLRGAIAGGADGFLPKSVNTQELLFAVRAVASGNSYISPSIAERVMQLAGGRGTSARRLTDRELEVLRLLAQGLRPTDIAAHLFISPKTLKNHLAGIYHKLGVNAASQAVAEAFRLGIVANPR